MNKPGMIITGAAGFLGRRLVESFQPQYEIFAIDRRPPQASGAPEGAGIHWFQSDICQFQALREVFNTIREQRRVEQFLHLAGYYDFSGDDHPEYSRSNVEGMQNVVELATQFDLHNFVFTSSVAACPFPAPNEAVTEDTPPAAPPPYSKSKRAGEEILRDYKDQLPSTIVRLAAIYTDWCEYEPLENFLRTWFSGGWTARVLGGRGLWAIPYMHMHDLVAFFHRVVEMSSQLKPLDILIGSPNGSTTHLDLYREATRSYFGSAQPAIHVPKPLARLGISMREMLGRITGQMPFERAWMGDYIDLQLNVDASQTHYRLNWSPNPSLGILRRMPVIVRNMRKHPEEWSLRHQQRKQSRSGEIAPGQINSYSVP